MRQEKKRRDCCTGYHYTVTEWHKTIILWVRNSGRGHLAIPAEGDYGQMLTRAGVIFKPWLGWMSWIAQEHGCYWCCMLTGRSAGLSAMVSTCDLSSMVVSSYPDSFTGPLPSPRVRVPLDSVETEWPLLTWPSNLQSVISVGFCWLWGIHWGQPWFKGRGHTLVLYKGLLKNVHACF